MHCEAVTKTNKEERINATPRIDGNRVVVCLAGSSIDSATLINLAFGEFDLYKTTADLPAYGAGSECW